MSLNTEWATPPELLTLPGDGVHVWRVRLSRTPSELQSLRSLLADDELERAERYHFERDRTRFVVARGMLRTILGRYLGLDPGQLSFCYGVHGKPAVIDTSGPHAFRFNLAHSHEMALLAITLDRQIGVDVEYVRSEFASEEIAEHYFSRTEVGKLRSLEPAERVEAFFNCWTRKEAYIKARGEGLSLPLNQFDVSLNSGEEQVTLHVPGSEVEAGRWSIHSLAPADNYVGALVVEGHDWEMKCWEA